MTDIGRLGKDTDVYLMQSEILFGMFARDCLQSAMGQVEYESSIDIEFFDNL